VILGCFWPGWALLIRRARQSDKMNTHILEESGAWVLKRES